jgi:glucose-1-phosphate thymidylyltransferase
MTPTTKAVILAAGLGTRMRKADEAAALDPNQAAVANTGVKALIPIDRPFLDYVLHVLAEAGIADVCLVIGPKHDELRQYYGRKIKPTRLKIHFATQPEPKGTADAVRAAESFAANDPFLMLNSDNYYPLAAIRALRQLGGAGVVAFDRKSLIAGGNIPAERVEKFSIVRPDPQGNLQKIIEKPDAATLAGLGDNLLVSMNCWSFSTAIFKACAAIGPSPRGEYEIPDAVQYATDTLGERFKVIVSHDSVLDLSSRTDIASVTKTLAGSPVNL